MLDKLVIGTANFTQPYGILSKGETLASDQIYSILVEADKEGITTLDTAASYGNLLPIVPEFLLSRYKIITKISVLESHNSILDYFSSQKKFKKFPGFYGVLIHDPQNIPLVDKPMLKKLLDSLRHEYGIQKIGVSVYHMKELESFNSVCLPDIIQIPLNPFNQTFNDDYFKSFVQANNIEVHARSLFLQGILLSDVLPKKLKPIEPFWLDFQKRVAEYPSRLHALMQWAFSFFWVKSWVVGVSSTINLEELIKVVNNYSQYPEFKNRLPEFQPVDHPLVDPRCWRA